MHFLWLEGGVVPLDTALRPAFRLTGVFKLSIVCQCLFPVMDCKPFGVPSLVPSGAWDWLQASSPVQNKQSGDG